MTPAKRDVFDATTGDPVAVLAWLAANPPPGGPSKELKRWQRQARTLGEAAVPALLHALEFAPSEIQYPAQLALRVLGWSVWGHGYGRDFHYTVAGPGAPESRIDPVLVDDTIGAIVLEPAARYTTAADAYEQIEAAGREIEVRREQMRELASVRSRLVADLLDEVPRAEIAARLGVSPNYVNQLAAEARRKRRG